MGYLSLEKNARFAFIERLGAGQSTEVHRVVDLMRNQREVALKFLKKPDPLNASRLRLEFETLSLFNHPNILSVFDLGDLSPGQPGFTSEFVPGQMSLRRGVLNGSACPTFSSRLDLIKEILQALDCIHQRGILHRDIKPSNILIKPSPGGMSARLCDFGMAGVPRGQVAGTPQYMAPEIIRRQGIDRRSDLYALGVVIFELLTDQLPFRDEDLTSLLHQHLHAKPPAIRPLNPRVTPALEALVHTLLEKEPSYRFPDASEVLVALEETRSRLPRHLWPRDTRLAPFLVPSRA